MSDDAALAERLFGSVESVTKAYESGLRGAYEKLSDTTGHGTDVTDGLIADAALFFADAEIAREAPQINAGIARHLAAPASAEQVQEWATESRSTLREQYGAAEAQKRLAAVQKFIADRPQMAERLNRSGYAWHPDLVTALAANVHKLRAEPRKR